MFCLTGALQRRYGENTNSSPEKHVAEDGNDSGSDDLKPFQIEAGKMAADTQVGVIRSAAA